MFSDRKDRRRKTKEQRVDSDSPSDLSTKTSTKSHAVTSKPYISTNFRRKSFFPKEVRQFMTNIEFFKCML